MSWGYGDTYQVVNECKLKAQQFFLDIIDKKAVKVGTALPGKDSQTVDMNSISTTCHTTSKICAYY